MNVTNMRHLFLIKLVLNFHKSDRLIWNFIEIIKCTKLLKVFFKRNVFKNGNKNFNSGRNKTNEIMQRRTK